ncbi:PH domain-containing protein [Streptomyces calidiresistens]|uniref:PH domain-containing protein n=1 Tax=Streptomyces calidiresistens TaxID=1485586 RepID=A0A7W3T8R2_9ACTN|nr:PH domain-containing protein [Streptomyces calidiresistens]MBB0232873.1 PH domain-containing protein [Streptomyces calidiresistens]
MTPRHTGPADPTGSEPPTLPMVFSPTRTRVVLMTLGAFSFVVLTVIAVLLPAGGAVAWGVAEKIAISLSGLLIWGVLALLSRPRAVARPEGLTVVNLTRRRTLEWPEIVGVNLRSGDPWVSLDLQDGSTMAVMAIQPGVGRERAITETRALRRLVEAYGTAGSGD